MLVVHSSSEFCIADVWIWTLGTQTQADGAEFYGIIINQSFKKIRQYVQTSMWITDHSRSRSYHTSISPYKTGTKWFVLLNFQPSPQDTASTLSAVRSQGGAMLPICLQTYLQVEIMKQSLSPQLFLSVTYYPPELVRSRQCEKWEVTGWQDWPLSFIVHISVSLCEVKYVWHVSSRLHTK